MKILTTSDWHLGNLFHGNDRLPEHQHFLAWLLDQIQQQQPDALLVAGDVFDNGNPSAAAQSAYYEFLADATQRCPDMQIVITAGNHDSASRIEAPRALLSRHKVQVRGNVHRTWHATPEGGEWQNDYQDLLIPITGADGQRVIVLAVPFLRTDVLQHNSCYSQGVRDFLGQLTALARQTYPDTPLVMMAHMYAQGAEIASYDASEKIIIGGQEEVSIKDWTDHPDYLVCGHIHKRQHIWKTDWARYCGSVLPMSAAEVDYLHGVDLVTIDPGHKPQVTFLQYQPQHPLLILPVDGPALSPKKLQKLIVKQIPERTDGELSAEFVYLFLRVNLDNAGNNQINELEQLVGQRDAVLCKVFRESDIVVATTLSGGQELHSIDDILNRNPLITLGEAFVAKHNQPMTEHQEQMLKELLLTINQPADNA